MHTGRFHDFLTRLSILFWCWKKRGLKGWHWRFWSVGSSFQMKLVFGSCWWKLFVAETESLVWASLGWILWPQLFVHKLCHVEKNSYVGCEWQKVQGSVSNFEYFCAKGKSFGTLVWKFRDTLPKQASWTSKPERQWEAIQINCEFLGPTVCVPVSLPHQTFSSQKQHEHFSESVDLSVAL